MRFPARLRVALAGARLARAWRPRHGAGRFQFVDVAEILDAGATRPVSREKLEEILAARKPLIWMGGSEPLDHPGAGHLVRALAQSARFVFVETSGCALRRRIHEFPPLPGIIFAVRLENMRLENRREERHASASALAQEGIRAAQLSGFWTVAHVPVSADTELAAVGEFAREVRGIEIDGWLATAANASAAALRRAEEARRFIAHPLWRSFSEMIEPVLLGRTGEGSLAGVKVHEAAGQDALEEQVVPLGTGPEGPQEGVPL
jgi:hypothetical protein